MFEAMISLPLGLTTRFVGFGCATLLNRERLTFDRSNDQSAERGSVAVSRHKLLVFLVFIMTYRGLETTQN
jgi:hypothetical protein